MSFCNIVLVLDKYSEIDSRVLHDNLIIHNNRKLMNAKP
jgi:hypothetical protein